MDDLVKKALFDKLSLDPNDPNLKDTPERVQRMFSELYIPKEHAEKIIREILTKIFPTDYDGIVMVANIIVYSFCPHHLLPVEYEIDIAYIPGSGQRVEAYRHDKELSQYITIGSPQAIGLSKLERIADTLSSQLILQETLTKEIADTIMKGLDAKGVAVILKGIHMCMRMRGIKSKRSIALTSYMLGAFRDHDATRLEFFELLKHSRR